MKSFHTSPQTCAEGPGWVWPTPYLHQVQNPIWITVVALFNTIWALFKILFMPPSYLCWCFILRHWPQRWRIDLDFGERVDEQQLPWLTRPCSERVRQVLLPFLLSASLPTRWHRRDLVCSSAAACEDLLTWIGWGERTRQNVLRSNGLPFFRCRVHDLLG
jgi:hypothetical protein